ncbi:MAG: sugar phosphate nucleotidyltransferase, partial [Gemmataceae bacterium]
FLNLFRDQLDRYGEVDSVAEGWRGALATAGEATTLVLNGDDLIGRADLKRLGEVPAGILVHSVGTPEAFGIVFAKPDGTLEHIIEKPQGLPAPQMANIGGYVFPRSVFDLTLTLSPRNEYEITEAVAKLAEQGPFHVVRSDYWLPIGDIDQWCWSQLKDVGPVR